MALRYATAAFFTTTSIYSGGATVTDAPELDRLLARCEDDVDAYVGPWARDTTTGRKFGDLTTNPVGLTAAQVTTIREAVCCQALWRAAAGEGEFINGQYEGVSGPDFATQGRRPRLSPQAQALLKDAGLVIRTASLA